MTLIPQTSYLTLNPDTVDSVRKEYNLDKPGAMDQAIDILQDWIKKQEHFVKKDFSREYLERFIICSKGSVERAKSKLDKLCTLRTTAPNLFEKCHAKNDFPNLHDVFLYVPMPNLCEDHDRIIFLKIICKNITPADAILTVMHYFNIIFEYAKLYDYAKSYSVVYDFSEVNVMDVITGLGLKFVDFRNATTLCFEAHGFRAKRIILISPSNMVHTLVKMVKTCLSEKLGQRICVLKNAESLEEFISKRYLPKEYGGEQKCLLDLFGESIDDLSSEKVVAHMREMKQASTNEKLRSSGQFNTESLGMPGTFKMLSID